MESAGEAAAAAPSATAVGPTLSGTTREGDAEPTPAAAEAVDADAVLKELAAELEALHGDRLRRRLRQLQLHWHPDRACRDGGVCADDACRIFGLVQGVWESRILAAVSAIPVGAD